MCPGNLLKKEYTEELENNNKTAHGARDNISEQEILLPSSSNIVRIEGVEDDGFAISVCFVIFVALLTN